MSSDLKSVNSNPPTPDIHLLANLPGLLDGLAPFFQLGAAKSREEYVKMVLTVIRAKFAPEIERIGVLSAEATARVSQFSTVISGLKARLCETPRRVPVSEPLTCIPRGLDRGIFFGCSLGALVVTAADGLNASFLAARELQSMVAGLAFLVPALSAPILAKFAITRLPGRSRFWTELGLGLVGIGTAGFFGYQFVSVFTSTPPLDEIASGGGLPGMKYLYLATLALGFLVVYFLLSKAISMVKPGPADKENEEYAQVSGLLASAEKELARAQAELDAHKPRLDKIETYIAFLLETALCAADVERAKVEAEALEEQTRISKQIKQANRVSSLYGSLLGNGSRNPINGDSAHLFKE